MIQEKTMMVSNVTDSGVGFGHDVNTGETIFIPAKIIKATNLQADEIVSCKVKPNIVEVDDVPWFAIAIYRQDSSDALSERVHDIICEMGMMTPEEIAGDLLVDRHDAEKACASLFSQQRILRIVAYSSPNSGPQATFYAKDMSALEV